MNLLLTLLQSVTEAFVSGLWKGVALVLALTLALRLLPRLTPAIRFAVWATAFLAAGTVPFVHLPSSPATTPVLHVNLGWVLTIAASWLAFSTIRLTRLAINALAIRRIWLNAVPIVAPIQVQAILNTISRRPALCLSSDVDTPSVIGFLAPRLLIPVSLYPTLTQPELHQIALHECEHLRRRDDWINLLQKLALALFPLNPALWFADRRLGLERELACDAAVVAASAAPLAYARSLTHLAEHRLLGRRLALALSAWGRQSELVRRVHTLLRPFAPVSPLRTRASVAILTATLATGAFELAHAPRLISFVDTAVAAVPEAAPFLPALPKPVPAVFHLPTNPTLATPVSTRCRSVRRQQQVRQAAPTIVLTSAHGESEHQTTRRTPPAYFLTTDFSPAYAAVPFADGWLIIQL